MPLLRKGVVPTVLLLDPVSFGGGGTGDVRETAALLSDLEVAHYIITRDLLDSPKAHPDRRGYWGQVFETGRAIPVRRPRNISWRVLS